MVRAGMGMSALFFPRGRRDESRLYSDNDGNYPFSVLQIQAMAWLNSLANCCTERRMRSCVFADG